MKEMVSGFNFSAAEGCLKIRYKSFGMYHAVNVTRRQVEGS